MYRLSLVVRIAGSVLVLASAAWGVDLGRHFEPGKLSEDCTPCHQGHGESRTPMLRTQGDQMCLSCHQTGAAEPGRRTA